MGRTVLGVIIAVLMLYGVARAQNAAPAGQDPSAPANYIASVAGDEARSDLSYVRVPEVVMTRQSRWARRSESSCSC